MALQNSNTGGGANAQRLVAQSNAQANQNAAAAQAMQNVNVTNAYGMNQSQWSAYQANNRGVGPAMWMWQQDPNAGGFPPSDNVVSGAFQPSAQAITAAQAQLNAVNARMQADQIETQARMADNDRRAAAWQIQAPIEQAKVDASPGTTHGRSGATSDNQKAGYKSTPSVQPSSKPVIVSKDTKLVPSAVADIINNNKMIKEATKPTTQQQIAKNSQAKETEKVTIIPSTTQKKALVNGTSQVAKNNREVLAQASALGKNTVLNEQTGKLSIKQNKVAVMSTPKNPSGVATPKFNMLDDIIKDSNMHINMLNEVGQHPIKDVNPIYAQASKLPTKISDAVWKTASKVTETFDKADKAIAGKNGVYIPDGISSTAGIFQLPVLAGRAAQDLKNIGMNNRIISAVAKNPFYEASKEEVAEYSRKPVSSTARDIGLVMAGEGAGQIYGTGAKVVRIASKALESINTDSKLIKASGKAVSIGLRVGKTAADSYMLGQLAGTGIGAASKATKEEGSGAGVKSLVAFNKEMALGGIGFERGVTGVEKGTAWLGKVAENHGVKLPESVKSELLDITGNAEKIQQVSGAHKINADKKTIPSTSSGIGQFNDLKTVQGKKVISIREPASTSEKVNTLQANVRKLASEYKITSASILKPIHKSVDNCSYGHIFSSKPFEIH